MAFQGRIAHVLVVHQRLGMPLDLNDQAVLEEIFMWKEPGMSNSDLNRALQQKCSAFFSCPQSVRSCNRERMERTMEALAVLNRKVHNTRMDDVRNSPPPPPPLPCLQPYMYASEPPQR